MQKPFVSEPFLVSKRLPYQLPIYRRPITTSTTGSRNSLLDSLTKPFDRRRRCLIRPLQVAKGKLSQYFIEPLTDHSIELLSRLWPHNSHIEKGLLSIIAAWRVAPTHLGNETFVQDTSAGCIIDCLGYGHPTHDLEDCSTVRQRNPLPRPFRYAESTGDLAFGTSKRFAQSILFRVQRGGMGARASHYRVNT